MNVYFRHSNPLNTHTRAYSKRGLDESRRSAVEWYASVVLSVFLKNVFCGLDL